MSYFEQYKVFNEPISEENIVLMGELLALQAIKTVIPYSDPSIEKMYRGLIKDIHHKHELGHVLSDGYDVV